MSNDISDNSTALLTSERYTAMVAWLLRHGGFDAVALTTVDPARVPAPARQSLIAAFRRQAGLPAGDHFDDAAVAALAKPAPAQPPTQPRVSASISSISAVRATGMTAPLDSVTLRQARKFNKGRYYTKRLWRRIQKAIGTDADGIPGKDTAHKLAGFQSGAGLPVHGQADPTTLSALHIGQFFALDERAFFFAGPMAIDADGAPNAYHPKNIGIDSNANAGISSKRAKPWGIVLDATGEPYIQTKKDPYPGYYVSPTSLLYGGYRKSDPRRYVDSASIPYIALPGRLNSYIPTAKVRTGDIALVTRYPTLDRLVYAVFADVAPKIGKVKNGKRVKWIDTINNFGEGSVKLAQELGHRPFSKKTVGGKKVLRANRSVPDGVIYVVFPGTGDYGRRQPLTTQDIATMGARAFGDWGGMSKLRAATAVLEAAGNLS